MFWNINYDNSPDIYVNIYDGVINNETFEKYCIEFLKIFLYAKNNKIKLNLVFNISLNHVPSIKIIYKNIFFMKKIRQLGIKYLIKLYFILENKISRNLMSVLFSLVKPSTPYIICSKKDFENNTKNIIGLTNTNTIVS